MAAVSSPSQNIHLQGAGGRKKKNKLFSLKNWRRDGAVGVSMSKYWVRGEVRDEARWGSLRLDKRNLQEAKDQSAGFELVNAPD